MVREVGLPKNKQSWNVAHKIIVHPKATHSVVYGWVDSHRILVGILPRNAFVHIEEIAVTLFNKTKTETGDGISKIQVDPKSCISDTIAFIADALSRPG